MAIEMIFPLKMVIFHCYVSLPEGIYGGFSRFSSATKKCYTFPSSAHPPKNRKNHTIYQSAAPAPHKIPFAIPPFFPP
jgi:hypothetical protein